MKKIFETPNQLIQGMKRALIMTLIITWIFPAYAQQQLTIKGKILEQNSNEPVPFANVAFFGFAGTDLITGVAGDMDGNFSVICNNPGKYRIQVSAIGYETVSRDIEFLHESTLDLGNIYLPFEEIKLEGITIIGNRIIAGAETDKTVFNVNKKMQEASTTGVDILKLIPGVQMDIRQNISLEGSQNILILVNGRERDRSFLSQLSAGQIDKVEVISNPSAQYDASVTGVINIVLHKDKNSGFSGHIYGEIPLSQSEIYIFPNYSLNYGVGKLNFFTSYNGELSQFKIREGYKRKYENGSQEIVSRQYINQKTWSHRFHYGLDYFINEKNQLNFYAYYNPYSNEHDGNVELSKDGDTPLHWSAKKDDTDKNHSVFYSLYYKHIFDATRGHEMALDLSYFNMNGENTTHYYNKETGYDRVNSLNPLQKSWNAKLDYSLPVNRNVKIISGMQFKQRELSDTKNFDFSYSIQNLAAHASLSFKTGKMDFLAGMRFENSLSESEDSDSDNISAWLPNMAFNYRFSTAKSLRLNWRSAISYPGFYQLNTLTNIEDPFTIHSGNSGLKPVLSNEFNLTYSYRFQNHFITTGLFYHKMTDVINPLTILNNEGIFETTRSNLGEISQYGVQFSGSISLGSKGGFQPYFKVFELYSSPNSFAMQHGIKSRKQLAYGSGFSAFANLGSNFTAALMFQYSSPLNEIQSNYFSGAQYFLSLEKNLGRGFKAGMVTAVPLMGKLTYQGSEIKGADFYSRSQGDIKMSTVPVWFKFSYNFSKGKERSKIQRRIEETEEKRKKGF